MNIGTRASTQEINAQIVEDFFEGQLVEAGGRDGVPLSVAELMQKYGRSESGVNKLLAAYRAQYEAEFGHPRQRKGKPRDPRLMEGKKSLGKRHANIGLAITRFMTENELTPTAFGMLISRSRVQVGNMLVGAHDLTMMEVEKISEVLGIPFMDLVQEIQPQVRTRLVA